MLSELLHLWQSVPPPWHIIALLIVIVSAVSIVFGIAFEFSAHTWIINTNACAFSAILWCVYGLESAYQMPISVVLASLGFSLFVVMLLSVFLSYADRRHALTEDDEANYEWEKPHIRGYRRNCLEIEMIIKGGWAVVFAVLWFQYVMR